MLFLIVTIVVLYNYFILILIQGGSTYGQLFVQAMKETGMLCLGLYRLHDPENIRSRKRYVITNPPADLKLLSSDRVNIVFSNSN